MQHEEIANIFRALSDQKRVVIIDMLRSGERCACQILENLDIGQSSLSYHMKILVDSGIVEGRQEGKWMHYSISEQGVLNAAERLAELTSVSEEAVVDCACKGIRH